ncbi:AAA family ATPase [Rubripirellula obstinata]|uniref:AAA family ATPase n=1 Tax=Rubripirellula obstinata TaxID=406547 RepID=UPI003B846F2F
MSSDGASASSDGASAFRDAPSESQDPPSSEKSLVSEHQPELGNDRPRIGNQDASVSPFEDAKITESLRKLDQVRSRLQNIIRGKADVIESVLTAMLAGGSVLLEDVPGVGKTTLAKSLASLIDLKFARVQCTPDLLPADILGSSVFQPATGKFEFRPGPIFCDLLIADEVNRASPRTQSALLEAMAESQVTIDGNQYELKQPFLVIATQNPSGFEGTFPLPESQLDRFLLRLSMDYPDAESEIDLLMEAKDELVSDEGRDDGSRHQPVMDRSELLTLQSAVRQIHVERKVASYVVDLVGSTRRDSRIRVGCSPRGSKMLLQAAKAKAMLSQRSFVIPDDVQSLAVSVIAHRLVPRSGVGSSSSAMRIVEDILQKTDIPV